jgi:hypothetical protein
MKKQLIEKKHCYNHQEREPVAKCPECGNYFCWECITEFEYRVLCAECIKKKSVKKTEKPGGVDVFFRLIFIPLKVITGIIITWAVFFVLAQGLILIPDNFHSGRIFHEQEKK